MALCAWGSQFLSGKNELEDWYRHGIFWAAQQQFRQFKDRQLVAENFSSWLMWLKQRGATRLTLHSAESVILPATLDLDWNDRAIRVHFSENDELWACAYEKTTYFSLFEHEHLYQNTSLIPDSGYYAGAIDSYFCVGTEQKNSNTPQTDWDKSAIALHAELFAPSSRRAEAWPPPAEDLLIASHTDTDWASLPALPKSHAYGLAHRLLNLLKNESGRFANDTHCKNEGNLYAFASNDEAEQISQWGNRLHAWLDALQIAAANETRWLDSAIGSGDVPVKEAPVAAGDPPLTHSSNAQHAETKNTHTINKIGSVVAFAVLTIFTIAVAKLINQYEWLALLIALPLMFYAARKK